MSPRTKSYILLFIATLIWGVAGPVIKFTLGSFSPLVFLFYRLGIQAIIGIVWLRYIPHPGWPKNPTSWLIIIFYCVLAVPVSLGLLFLGFNQTSALAVSIIGAIYPMMVAVAGVMWLREHVTHREKIGMVIALLGTLLVIIEPFFNGYTHHDTSISGNLFVLASISVEVVVVVLAKLLMRHHFNALAMTHLSFIIGFVTLAPITLHYYSIPTIYNSLSTASLAAHIGVGYMALISGIFAYTIWLVAQKTIEIGEAAMFTYLYPVITLPLSIFWLHENITTTLIIGSLIIGVGVVIAETKRKASRPTGRR